MTIEYRTRQLERICTNLHEATKHHGDRMAELIHQRIQELKAASNLRMLVEYRIGRCHALVGDRAGQYAMDLVHPSRLILIQSPVGFEIVKIMKIEDYH